jgi:hypothetical protein
MSYDEAEMVRTRPLQGPMPGDALGGRQKRIWEATESLDNALDTLSQRIAPVLLPERTSPALAGIAGDSDERSDLGGFLDQLHDQLVRLGYRAAELSERTDL